MNIFLKIWNWKINLTHMTIGEITLSISHILWNYPLSFFGARKHPHTFKDIHTYCMFIGYRRSGKTLTASLLDAHPHMIIADELGVIRNIYARFKERQIYYLLLKNSRDFTRKGRSTKGYSHRIMGQYQGSFNKKLFVIGDNHGQGAAVRLRLRPYLLDRLRQTITPKIRVFHVIRNPYDNISSIAKRMNTSIYEAITYYFDLCETATTVLKGFEEEEVMSFRYESLIDDPEKCLKNIGNFLGVEMPEDYLNACIRMIYKKPSKTRLTAVWNKQSIALVEKKMSQFPYLDGYRYDS